MELLEVVELLDCRESRALERVGTLVYVCMSLVLTSSTRCPVMLLSTADTSQAIRRVTDFVTLGEPGGASKLVHIMTVVPSHLYAQEKLPFGLGYEQGTENLNPCLGQK
jgi:hypothetical protein